MSVLFSANGASVWNPSAAVGRLFKGQVEAIAAVLDVPSGLGEFFADEYVIDMPMFERFLERLTEQYDDPSPFVIKALVEGVLGTSYVMVERGGGQVPEIDPQRVPGWEDLRYQFSRSMPA
jgi:hypothetical protein